MIVRQFNNPHTLFQKPDEEFGIAEPAIAGSTDSTGLIILSQEGREILVNRASVPELRKLLTKLDAAYAAEQPT